MSSLRMLLHRLFCIHIPRSPGQELESNERPIEAAPPRQRQEPIDRTRIRRLGPPYSFWTGPQIQTASQRQIQLMEYEESVRHRLGK